VKHGTVVPDREEGGAASGGRRGRGVVDAGWTLCSSQTGDEDEDEVGRWGGDRLDPPSSGTPDLDLGVDADINLDLPVLSVSRSTNPCFLCRAML